MLIVIAIIAILAAIALLAYQDFNKRARVSEVIMAGAHCRSIVTETVQSKLSLPGANAWGCEFETPPTGYVASIATDADGVIIITSQNIQGLSGSITLTPSMGLDGNVIAPIAGSEIRHWICGGTIDVSIGPAPVVVEGARRQSMHAAV